MYIKPLLVVSTNLTNKQILLAPMGVLAPGSAHARPSARPPMDTTRIFQRMCLGAGGENYQKVFLINFLAKSENFKNF
jgi:hypothetical protein